MTEDRDGKGWATGVGAKGTLIPGPGRKVARAHAVMQVGIQPGQSDDLHIRVHAGSSSSIAIVGGISATRLDGAGKRSGLNAASLTLPEGRWQLKVPLKVTQKRASTEWLEASFDAAFPLDNTTLLGVEICPDYFSVFSWTFGSHSTKPAPIDNVCPFLLQPLLESGWSELPAPKVTAITLDVTPPRFRWTVTPTVVWEKPSQTYVVEIVPSDDAVAGSITVSLLDNDVVIPFDFRD